MTLIITFDPKPKPCINACSGTINNSVTFRNHQQVLRFSEIDNPAHTYLLKVSNTKTTNKATDIALVSLLLTLSIVHNFQCFYCKILTCNFRLGSRVPRKTLSNGKRNMRHKSLGSRPKYIIGRARRSQETPIQVFFGEICEIFKNTYFEEHLETTASGELKLSFQSLLLNVVQLLIATIALTYSL